MDELTCANCPFNIEPQNGKPFCIQDATCEISVKWLNEHERKIYNQALEDALRVVEWDGYTLDIKKRIEQLKR